jgi:hypothetical protein
MNHARGIVSRYPAAAALLLGLLGLYTLALDLGFILSLFQGEVAFDINLLHEVVHDVRHVAGFPCH